MYIIREATGADAGSIARIYNPYILETIVTFEEQAVSGADIAGRMAAAAPLPWLVAEEEGQIAGYAYASPWRGRSAYRFSVETTVYTAPGRGRQGIGTALYRALHPRLKELGYHTAIAGIALPNPASVALHEKLGYRQAAHFVQVGFKFGQWIDAGYWQCLL